MSRNIFKTVYWLKYYGVILLLFFCLDCNVRFMFQWELHSSLISTNINSYHMLNITDINSYDIIMIILTGAFNLYMC